MRHYEEILVLPASPERVFAFADDFRRFSSHMNESSWMMAGSTMTTKLDDREGKEVGSVVRMEGTVLGMRLYLDEIVTRREPPFAKEWKTSGHPKLLVIGHYKMGLYLAGKGAGTEIKVTIDYELPERNAWIGSLFGSMYAQWCVRQMTTSLKKEFDRPQTA